MGRKKGLRDLRYKINRGHGTHRHCSGRERDHNRRSVWDRLQAQSVPSDCQDIHNDSGIFEPQTVCDHNWTDRSFSSPGQFDISSHVESNSDTVSTSAFRFSRETMNFVCKSTTDTIPSDNSCDGSTGKSVNGLETVEMKSCFGREIANRDLEELEELEEGEVVDLSGEDGEYNSDEYQSLEMTEPPRSKSENLSERIKNDISSRQNTQSRNLENSWERHEDDLPGGKNELSKSHRERPDERNEDSMLCGKKKRSQSRSCERRQSERLHQREVENISCYENHWHPSKYSYQEKPRNAQLKDRYSTPSTESVNYRRRLSDRGHDSRDETRVKTRKSQEPSNTNWDKSPKHRSPRETATEDKQRLSVDKYSKDCSYLCNSESGIRSSGPCTSYDFSRKHTPVDTRIYYQRKRKGNQAYSTPVREKRICYGKETYLKEDLDSAKCWNRPKCRDIKERPGSCTKATVAFQSRPTHRSGLLGTISFLKHLDKQPNEVAMTLANRMDELDTYFAANEICPQIDQLLSILKRCAEATLCKMNMRQVMYILRKRKLFERKDVLEKLKESSILAKEVTEHGFMFCLLVVMKTMIQTVGLEQKDSMIAISLMKMIIQNGEDMFDKHRKLMKEIEDLYSEKANTETKGDENAEYFALTLPILPDIDSIRAGDKTNIPQHTIGKPFSSDQWYVSYMYVLFREDFVRPLMNGIRDYISHQDRASAHRFRSTDVRIYQDVYLLSTNTQTDNGIVWTIQFPCTFSRKSYIPSVLQYGSLLCLSHDGFRSIHYATVVNRDLCQLTKGQIDIKFIHRFDLPNALEETFVMVESRAFYGAYSHTLSSLQFLASGLAEEENTVPMGKYLTGRVGKPSFPAYLQQNSSFTFECLQRYGSNRDNTGTPSSVTNVSNFDVWPSALEIGLDLSQYEALKLVLTSEVAMIQGPPGTGKTMMGIRIAELLLSNKHLWESEMNKGPLLLVSYTNHALDQFLQLLLATATMDHCLPHDVVRVGSRCEIAELDKHALKRLRRYEDTFEVVYKKRRRGRQSQFTLRGTPLSREYNAHFRTLKDIERRIELLREAVTDFQTYLVHEETFMDKIMTGHHYSQLTRRGYFERYLPENNTMLWLWLNLDSLRFERDNSPKAATVFNENPVTAYDIAKEDMGRILDDYEEDTDIFHQLDTSQRPRAAIDMKMLYGDSFFKNLSKKDIDLILNGIYYKLQSREKMTLDEMMAVQNIWKLNIHDRWRLYRYWVSAAMKPFLEQLRIEGNQFEEASQRYCEVRNMLDLHIMRNASVVAMTTTAASRYTTILRDVKAPIVIIEEAAQVPEQHVLGSLSPACQHLIMIGDHQQLKPAYNDYSLAKTYHTDVSLFERLVRSNFPYQQLENQHRMRPEISTLLIPHIYKTLSDDESVFGYPSVRGTSSSVFFLTHDNMEDNDEESLSHSNQFEAEFLTKLYRHLRLQGYSASEITVLAPYKDQVQVLRRLIRETENSDLVKLKRDTDTLDTDRSLKKDSGVRITPVDNFQGEENRIILLSLVRSNKSGRIGHLAAANRVCVSLSRAKEGLFVIGNLTCLRRASSLWEKIVSKAEENGICGKFLELKCSKHPDHKMIVESAKDFEKFKDGGCNQSCNTRLECGHSCGRNCHTDDPEHRTPCQKPCVKYCPRNHPHERKCDEPIGSCREKLEVDLPKCGHKVMAECFRDIKDVICVEKCLNKLLCGHICQRHCGETCNSEKDCNELVKVTRKCGHTFQIACCKQQTGLCTVKCTSTLDCGHPCVGTCGECHSGRLHKPCRKKCERKLICGHLCKADCTEVCPPCTKPCSIRCIHSFCKNICAKICTPCKEPCSWTCRKDCKNEFKCTKLCFENCDRQRCNTPCTRIMPCGHRCIAMKCEKCLCRECSDKSEFEIFFGTEDDVDAVFYRLPDCGHIFEVTSLDTYMDSDVSSETITMKTCPRCTTPVLNAERYGNVIRKVLKDIDVVKSKLLSRDADMTFERCNLRYQLSKIEEMDHWNIFENSLKKTKNTVQIDALRMQFGFYANVNDTLKNLNQVLSYMPEEMGSELKQELISLQSWVLIKRFRFSDQELQEFKQELTRIRLCYRTFVMKNTLSKKETVPIADMDWIDKATEKLSCGEKVAEVETEKIETRLKELETQYPRSGLLITEEERIMIVQAMGFSQKGHWYKCKNGHVYAIGDCGGATMESRCPECAETIGGGNHRLRGDNSLASEMDGARFSAWSEEANMLNYHFDDV